MTDRRPSSRALRLLGSDNRIHLFELVTDADDDAPRCVIGRIAPWRPDRT